MRSRLARQLGRPTGFLGRQAAREMAMVNGRMIASAIDLLDPRGDDDVLEIGFGAGRSLQTLAKRTTGTVIGVDHSPTMVATAARKNRAGVRAGRIRVLEGSVEHLPVEAATVDKVLAVNSLPYWSDPGAGLAEICRVMRSGALAVLSVRPPDVMRAVGVEGPAVTLIDESDFPDLVIEAGLEAGTPVRGDDRIGGFIHLPATKP